MKKNRQNIKTKILTGLFLLVPMLLVATGLSATNKNQSKGEIIKKIKASFKEVNQKGKGAKGLDAFVPSVKVSADQTVAFPTDI